jgi:hypothetical protein
MNEQLEFSELKGLTTEEALKKPIEQSSRASRFASFLSGEGSAFTALTFGDLIYDVVRIDPTVVEAADFARSADLSSIPNFTTFADRINGLPEGTYDGNISQIQGYVAERVVAQTLRAQGAEVQFPESSSEEGYDLIVNGDKFQVKNLSSPDGVYEHLQKNPSIPVFVNEELAKDFEGDDRVFPISGLKHDEIVDAAKDTIEAGSDVLDLNIPLITTAISAARNGYALFREKTDPMSALENVALDVTSRSTGGIAGAYLTTTALWGIGITSGWGTIILPIFGAVAGHEVGRKISDRIKIEVLCREEKGLLQEAITQYLKAASLILNGMIETAKNQLGRFETALSEGTDLQIELWNNWQRRLFEEIEYRGLQLQKIDWGAQNNGVMANCEGSVLASAVEAMAVAKRAGIISANLPSDHRVLIEAANEFRVALEKRLL